MAGVAVKMGRQVEHTEQLDLFVRRLCQGMGKSRRLDLFVRRSCQGCGRGRVAGIPCRDVAALMHLAEYVVQLNLLVFGLDLGSDSWCRGLHTAHSGIGHNSTRTQ